MKDVGVVDDGMWFCVEVFLCDGCVGFDCG